MIRFYNTYDDLNDDSGQSMPFMVYPNVISDERGSFSEVLKDDSTILDKIPFMKSCSWIKQINRSKSSSKVIRGCHAQKGSFCQAKLVEALTTNVIDMITDARPESKSFGITSFFVLNPDKQNKLFVPRGFLHAFIVPNSAKCEAIFNYYCDNVYNKASEISISPTSVLTNLDLDKINFDNDNCNEVYDTNSLDNINEYQFSDKDLNGLDYMSWMKQIKDAYESTGKSWWR